MCFVFVGSRCWAKGCNHTGERHDMWFKHQAEIDCSQWTDRFGIMKPRQECILYNAIFKIVTFQNIWSHFSCISFWKLQCSYNYCIIFILLLYCVLVFVYVYVCMCCICYLFVCISTLPSLAIFVNNNNYHVFKYFTLNFLFCFYIIKLGKYSTWLSFHIQISAYVMASTGARYI